MLISKPARAVVGFVLASVLLWTGGSAVADTQPPPVVPYGLRVIAADPTTALVGAPVQFYAEVAPVVHGLPVTVQRLVHGHWVVLSHVSPTDTGVIFFRERMPAEAELWTVRLTRAATRSGVAAYVSRSVRLRAVTTAFRFSLPPPKVALPSRGRLTLTGSVSPATSGHVELERRTPFGSWVPYGEARMTTPTTFTLVTTPLAPGGYVFRTVKEFSPTIAAGVGRPFHVTVAG